MSVIVLGMGFPEHCIGCPFRYDGVHEYCTVTSDDFDDENPEDMESDDWHPAWCPLRPLPDHHGKIIDADVLESEMFELWKKNEISNSDWIGFREILKDQETILETEIQDRRVNL